MWWILPLLFHFLPFFRYPVNALPLDFLIPLSFCFGGFVSINNYFSGNWWVLFTGWEECICALLFRRKSEEQNFKNMWRFWSKSLPIYRWSGKPISDNNRGTLFSLPCDTILWFMIYLIWWSDIVAFLWVWPSW